MRKIMREIDIDQIFLGVLVIIPALTLVGLLTTNIMNSIGALGSLVIMYVASGIATMFLSAEEDLTSKEIFFVLHKIFAFLVPIFFISYFFIKLIIYIF